MIDSETSARVMVDPCGLEPQTSSVSRKRSNQLSYGSISVNDYLKLLAELPALICTDGLPKSEKPCKALAR